MKSKTHWILILVATICFCVFGWIQRGQSSSSPAWEYKIMQFGPTIPQDRERMLNELGAQGWELALFQNDGGQTGSGYYYFKRAK